MCVLGQHSDLPVEKSSGLDYQLWSDDIPLYSARGLEYEALLRGDVALHNVSNLRFPGSQAPFHLPCWRNLHEAERVNKNETLAVKI